MILIYFNMMINLMFAWRIIKHHSPYQTLTSSWSGGGSFIVKYLRQSWRLKNREPLVNDK